MAPGVVPEPLAPAGAGTAAMPDDTASTRRGLACGLGAFAWWALLVPVYFRVMSEHGVDPFEVLAQRVVFGVPVLLAMLAFSRRIGEFVRAAFTPAALKILVPSTVLIGLNWYFFIRAVADGHLSHASLGYYINPLVSVGLGFLFLGERLRRAQWVAVAIAAGAVIVLTVAEGRVPYISVILPCSFGLYGLLRKKASVGPTIGLTFEMLMMLPLCAGLLVWLEHQNRGVFLHGPGWLTGLMLLGGMVTIVPLVWFTTAARLLPLSTLGLLQYLAPTGQLMLSALAFGEHFPPVKWMAFGLIWCAIAVFSTDAFRHNARQRRARRLAAGTPE